jgi:hypothetical protein
MRAKGRDQGIKECFSRFRGCGWREMWRGEERRGEERRGVVVLTDDGE